MQKIVFTVVLFTILAGCKTTENVRKTPITRDASLSYKEEDIKSGNLSNRDFNIQRADIELVNESGKVNLIGSLRYREEGKYLISIRAKNGLEVVRIFISNDTILANDRINKKIYYGTPSYLEKKYGICMSFIPIIFGDYVNETGNNEKIDDCKNGKKEIFGMINRKRITYSLDCKLNKIVNAGYFNENSEEGISISFGNFGNLDSLNYPGTIKITDTKEETVIKISVKKIDLLTGDPIKFIPGSSYEKVMLK